MLPRVLHDDNILNALTNNEINSVKELTKIKPLTATQCNMFVDTFLENGNEQIAKFLVNEQKCVPSLYAKQMAHINGHHKLSFWMDAYALSRNDTDIKTIHYNYKQNKWDECIPEEYRY